MNQPINNGKSWAAEFQPGSRGEKAIESLGLRCDHLRHDLLAMDTSRDALAAELAEARKVVADVIRWLECGAEAMAKTARPGDSRFGEALAEVVAAKAARDSGKASGGGGEDAAS